MSEVLKELKYLESHEWARVEDDGKVSVGITDFAQHALGDIVYVDLPEAGDEVTAGESFCEIESVKSVSGVYSPATGTVAEVNEALLDSPELINEDPYGSWMIKLENAELSDALLDSEGYEAVLENEEQ